jgi:thiosulfate dehydrogenase
MNRPGVNFQNWAAGILFALLAGIVGYSLPREFVGAGPSNVGNASATDYARPPKMKPIEPGEAARFSPPPEDKLPDGDFGEMVQLGEDIFNDTAGHAKEFVGNDLRCANCHLDAGRLANSAPLWAAYVAYPAFRSKNGHVNTFAERVQGCFQYSMNGKAPPLNDKVLVALESYAFALAKGAPTGQDLAGRGYPKLAKPKTLDRERGREVYAQNCAVCHGGNGEGQKTAEGQTVFPPLWGPRSYNWGAGMSSIANAAGFIKANMPLSQGNSLSDEDSWAVAVFIDSHERPQDPRFMGSIKETRVAHHNSPLDMYGTAVDGAVLGANSFASGTVPK